MYSIVVINFLLSDVLYMLRTVEWWNGHCVAKREFKWLVNVLYFCFLFSFLFYVSLFFISLIFYVYFFVIELLILFVMVNKVLSYWYGDHTFLSYLGIIKIFH